MAKAHIVTGSGTKITIEGTPEELASVLKQVGATEPSAAHETARASAPKTKAKANERSTPTNLIASLIDGGFFKKPKNLAEIKIALEEMGHHYPVTTLSPTLLRFIRQRQLRRMRESKKWVYTGG